MNEQNGHLPEGAQKLTLELLREKAHKWVKLPQKSELTEKQVYVKIRTIRLVDYLLMQPPDPPGSENWPDPEKEPEKRRQVAAKWYSSLSPENRMSRQKTTSEVAIRIIQLGLVEPKLSEDDVKDLGSDVDQLANDILRFSGFMKEEVKKDAQEGQAKEEGAKEKGADSKVTVQSTEPATP